MPISHDQAFELLPWLVNGSLAAGEREAVEEHLRSCLSCRRELKMQRHLHEALRAQSAVHLSPHSGFEALSRQLSGTAPPPGRPVWRSIGRIVAAAAAGIALVALLLWLAPNDGSETGRYQTLTAPAPAQSTGELDVVFTDTVTAAEINALLADIGAEIAAGPTELGRYTLRLRDSQRDEAAVTALVGRLAADPRVRFAGRAMAAWDGQ